MKRRHYHIRNWNDEKGNFSLYRDGQFLIGGCSSSAVAAQEARKYAKKLKEHPIIHWPYIHMGIYADDSGKKVVLCWPCAKARGARGVSETVDVTSVNARCQECGEIGERNP